MNDTYFIHLCEIGDVNVGVLYEENIVPFSVLRSGFCQACKHGHLHICQLLYKKNSALIVEWQGFVNACANGHQHIAEWWWFVDMINFLVLKYAFICVNAMEVACKHGHLDICQWLWKTFPHIADGVRKGNSAYNAIMSGNLELCQWLLTEVDHDAGENYALNWACKLDQLEVAQWVIERFPHTRETKGVAFYSACQYGRLRVVQWWSDIRNRHPLSDEDVYHGLAIACENLHMPVVLQIVQKWPGVDITAHGDQIFHTACDEDRVQMAEWLQQQIPHRYSFVKSAQPTQTGGHITSYSFAEPRPPLIAKTDYNPGWLKERMHRSGLGPELAANRFHPQNEAKWVGWGYDMGYESVTASLV